MQLSLIATAFAAILSTGYAETLRNSNSNLDGVPTAASPVAEAAQGMMEPLVDENVGKRTLVGAEEDATIMGANTNEGQTNGDRALGTKKDYSGQACQYCCNDDFNC
jgi:hypothetical protein